MTMALSRSTPAVRKPASNVRVVARVRPLLPAEVKSDPCPIVTCLANKRLHDPSEPEILQVGNGQRRWFELDAVLDDQCTQQDVYIKSGTFRAVTEDILKGYNCTILAYGQSGAGKTYSMGTADSGIGETAGVIPRACVDLFRSIEEKCDGNATVELSYMEIYNEEIRDLVIDFPKRNLRIRERLNGEVYVSGLTSFSVTTPEEIGSVMEVASKRRVTAPTKRNNVSSRSHAVCVLNVKGILEDSTKFQAKLTLVDLAGSERIRKTGAQGERLQESININKGLFILGQVISALSEQRPKYKRKPPYRESKLTRILQDSLGGNSRTIMIACLSPANSNLEETVNTLRYATSARNIKNTATQNLIENISQAEAAKLLRENQLFRNEVKDLQQTIQRMAMESNSVCSTDGMSDDESLVDMDDKPAQQIRELEKEVKKLKILLKESKEDIRNYSVASGVQLPAMKMKVQVLQDELEEAGEVKVENENLWKELAEVKADASSARLAATKLSQMMEDFNRTNSRLLSHDAEKRAAAEGNNSWNYCIVVLLSLQLCFTLMTMNDMFVQSTARAGFESQVLPVIRALGENWCPAK